MIIYLSGGMKGSWQDRVKGGLSRRHKVIDPREHGLSDPGNYTHWDLAAIGRADAVLAYIEPDNPSLYGLAVECGYASALRKLIVISGACPDRGRYLRIVTELGVRVQTLGDAIDCFNRW